MPVIKGSNCCNYLLYSYSEIELGSDNLMSTYPTDTPHIYEISSSLSLNKLGQHLSKFIDSEFTIYEFTGNRFIS